MSKKIFITGCAKSGTTLLLRMCYAFKDTDVIYREGPNGHEMDFDKFVKYQSEKKFTIGKRHPPALLSNVLLLDFQNQAGDIIREDIKVINVIRDGRDVVLSDANYVKPKRWIESMDQRNKVMFGNLIDLEVKYEDLVTNPEKIQRQMEDKFGLESEHSFKDYPEYVEDWVFEWNVSVLARAGKSNKTDYGKRKVDTRGIGKDLEAYKDLCTDLELPKFENHLKESGYS